MSNSLEVLYTKVSKIIGGASFDVFEKWIPYINSCSCSFILQDTVFLYSCHFIWGFQLNRRKVLVSQWNASSDIFFLIDLECGELLKLNFLCRPSWGPSLLGFVEGLIIEINTKGWCYPYSWLLVEYDVTVAVLLSVFEGYSCLWCFMLL